MSKGLVGFPNERETGWVYTQTLLAQNVKGIVADSRGQKFAIML